MPQHFRLRVLAATLPFLLTASYGFAQPVQPPTRAEAQAALSPTPAPFTNAQLDQMLAPIALYPDQLLVQVLMAATFPDQLVDAAAWLQDSHNAPLRGDDLANALEPLPWDPGVKSLVAFPQLIAMLTSHLDWTQAIGVAFANQQVQTMARVQFLRDRAKAAGTLKTTTQIAVTERDSDIIIEPANPDTIYVPVYNPADVYGTWPDADAPPVYIPPPPGFYEGALGAGIGFSVGLGVVAPLWGWGHPDWRRHDVVVDPGRYQHITRQTFITQNHITIDGGAWHRQGPVAMVPEARRPHPSYQGGEPPRGTIRPDAVAHPAIAPGPGTEQHGAPNGAGRPGEEHAQPPGPGSRPPEQHAPPGARPGEEHAPPPGPGPRPQDEHGPSQGARPGEEHAQPPAAVPRPQEEHAPPGARPGEEHAQPPGPGTRPGEEHAQPPRPGARPGEEHAPPPGPGAHPGEEHAPPPGPGARPGEEHAPPPGPGARPGEEHAQPPRPGARPGEEHAQPAQQPRPTEEHAQPPAPPPQAAHPAGPAPGEAHPAPQAAPPHPAGPPPQEARPQAPPQAAHPPGPQQQPHPGGPPHPGEHQPGDEDKK